MIEEKKIENKNKQNLFMTLLAVSVVALIVAACVLLILLLVFGWQLVYLI